MKKNNYLFFIFYFVTNLSFSQNEKLIYGKILSQNNPAIDIQVLNLVTEKSTITNNNGAFYIFAKTGDMLVFISTKYDYKRKFLEQSDIDKGNLDIELIKKPEQLEEVVVTKSKIDAVSLGIVPANQKTYTPAERKLFTAKSGVLDPLINILSGRTAMLKKEIIVEKNERALAKVSDLFEDEYYIMKLKIASEQIKAFQYFIIEDKEFAAALKSKNKAMMKFIMSKLAINFNDLLANEKK